MLLSAVIIFLARFSAHSLISLIYSNIRAFGLLSAFLLRSISISSRIKGEVSGGKG